jgi:hypothetical protein
VTVRLTHDEAARLGIRGATAKRLVRESDAAVGKRGNKFGAKRTNCRQGHVHASGAEARRCDELTLLERGGHIRKLEQQPVFHFTIDGRAMTDMRGRKVRYTADFRYEERFLRGAVQLLGPQDPLYGVYGWREVVEDVKSTATMTEAATLRLAMVRFFYPDIDLRTVS